MAYWLYWRIYELKIGDTDFQRTFGTASSLDAEFGNILRLLVSLGMLDRINGEYHVTRSGAYWVHRLQNEYS